MARPVLAACILVACLLGVQSAQAAEWMTGIATFTGSEVRMTGCTPLKHERCMCEQLLSVMEAGHGQGRVLPQL
jgi:hypothetical protein